MCTANCEIRLLRGHLNSECSFVQIPSRRVWIVVIGFMGMAEEFLCRSDVALTFVWPCNL